MMKVVGLLLKTSEVKKKKNNLNFVLTKPFIEVAFLK